MGQEEKALEKFRGEIKLVPTSFACGQDCFKKVNPPEQKLMLLLIWADYQRGSHYHVRLSNETQTDTCKKLLFFVKYPVLAGKESKNACSCCKWVRVSIKNVPHAIPKDQIREHIRLFPCRQSHYS